MAVTSQLDATVNCITTDSRRNAGKELVGRWPEPGAGAAQGTKGKKKGGGRPAECTRHGFSMRGAAGPGVAGKETTAQGQPGTSELCPEDAGCREGISLCNLKITAS